MRKSSIALSQELAVVGVRDISHLSDSEFLSSIIELPQILLDSLHWIRIKHKARYTTLKKYLEPSKSGPTARSKVILLTSEALFDIPTLKIYRIT